MISRRTFVRLAAAGLSSAGLQLAGCVEEPVTRGTGHLPTPEAPFTPNSDWYFVALQGAYEVDMANYRLRLGGLVEEPVDLSLQQLRDRFENVVLPITLACTGNSPNGRLFSSSWFRGVRTRDVIESLEIPSRATGAMLGGLDSYFAFRAMEILRDPETILAFEMGTDPEQTERLPIDHGFPLRILTPGTYGWVQPKWLGAISFVDDSHHWEVIRRSDPFADGRMFLASGFSYPANRASLRPGEQPLIGYAFGDGRAIAAIDVSIDRGPWQPATIEWNDTDDELPPSVWALWRFLWDAELGSHELSVRATYEDGDTQRAGRRFPYSGGSLTSILVEVE
jgi:DMSO/TMAO reductase YedYZ molybdopterin-dependent catalytic subunit